jgi:hypothetical protein
MSHSGLGEFFLALEAEIPGGVGRGVRYERQAHDGERVVVGGDPADAIDLAAEATMDDHLLAVAAGAEPDRFHQAPAFAGAIAGATAIDMPRVQAERAMIAVASTRYRRADEGPAMPALKRFLAVRDLVRIVVGRGLAAPTLVSMLVGLPACATSRYWFVGKMTIFLGVSVTWHW